MLQTKQQKAFRSFGPLAQLAEHLTFNQGVPRSSRGWITTQFTPVQKGGSFLLCRSQCGLQMYAECQNQWMRKIF